jgi:tetratricopeptide (TPR) repeat protein
MRKLIVLLAFSASLVATAAAATVRATTEKEAQKSVERLSAAFAAADKGDCKKALSLARPIADKPDAAGLNDRGAVAALLIVSRCEYETGQKDGAFADIRRATALEEAPDEVWHVRLAFDLQDKNFERAIETMEAMTQGHGQALNSAPQRWYWTMLSELERTRADALKSRLLKLLSDPAYSPTEPLATTDGFRSRYAGQLAASGNLDEAREMVADLKGASAIARASLDSRLRQFFPKDPDVRAAAERELAEHKRAMQLHPELLEAVNDVAGDLRVLGRPEEALKVLKAAEPGLQAFEDKGEHLTWWWNSLAQTYGMLGRYDEAVAAFRKGADLTEGGGPNISQRINLAALQNSFGHSDEALKTLAVFQGPGPHGSPYGEMQLYEVRGCAKAFSGQDAKAELDYIKAHDRDAPDSLQQVLLCMGDVDGAAAALIRRLDDPDQRSAVLMDASDFDDEPVKWPETARTRASKAMYERADVKAAIERAGGKRRFNVQSGEL